jgi:hypothetical protein
VVGSPAVRGSPGKRAGSTRGGSEGGHFNGSSPPLHLAFNLIGSSSGSADDQGDDDREKDLSPFFEAETPPSSRSHCCCCSSSSQSSSLSQPNILTPGTQSAQRTCFGSCGASPAAITKPQTTVAAKKHKQNFALETCDSQIGQPSSNTITLHGRVQRLQLPLVSNHDHPLRDRLQDPCAISSSTFSSAEADLSINFPPRDRMMGHGSPPQYSPQIGPSSSSSSSHLSLPQHLEWLQNTAISLCIDQEGFRTVFPAFKLVGYTRPTLPIHSSRAGMQKLLAGGNNDSSVKQLSQLMDQASADLDLAMNIDVGMAEFMPLKRESFVFHHSTLDPPPCVRRLSVNGDESKDYLSQYASLSVKSSSGFQVYVVRGSEARRGCSGGDTTGRSGGSCPTKFEWQFEYTVEDKRKADGTKAGGGDKFLTPLRFRCSPGLLHPKQSRKVTVLNVWKKSIQPRILAGKLEPLTITSPTTSGNQTHNLAGPLSPPTSPKSISLGALRFPSASKLWGKRTKSSPYRFDKGSDGSEEELIPSEDSATRKKRRPTSAYVPRVTREEEWPPQKWDGGTDAVRQANRNTRPATAGADGSRGRNRAGSFGRGAKSEGENERGFPRSQGGLSTTRQGYSRRPRTAR